MKFLDKNISFFSPERNKSAFLPKRYDSRLFSERLDVLIALAPAAFWSVYAYGPRTLLLILVCASVSLAADALCSFAFSGSFYNLLDLSSPVYGVMTAFFLSPKASLLHAVLISLSYSLVFKNLIGRFAVIRIHPVSAALACFALINFSAKSFSCVYPFGGGAGLSVPELIASESTQNLYWYEIFFGDVCAPLGCASALLLAAGGIYLAVRKITDIRVPLSYIAGLCIAAYVLSANANPFEDVLFYGVCGQAYFTAFFLCADKTYAPRSKQNSIIYGAVCGALAAVLCIKVSPLAAFPLSAAAGSVLARIFDIFYQGQKPFGMTGKTTQNKENTTTAVSDKK